MLISGYSSSDLFDITQQIESLTGTGKNVFYIAHRHRKKEDYREEVKSVSAQDTKNPFKKFEGKRVFIDTDLFMEGVWKALVEEEYPPVKKRWTWWRKRVKDCVRATHSIHRLTIAGLLFFKMSAHPIAEKYYKRAL